MKEFVHLHLHSEYSLLDGICRVNEIPAAAAALGQKAVAITDRAVMYGCAAFCDACEKAGVKPIIGCEISVTKGSRFDASDVAEPDHLVLLVKNETGYKNLIQIVSRAWLEGYSVRTGPRADLDLIRRYSDGLICLSGCRKGEIQRLLSKGRYKEADVAARRFSEIFGKDGFYLELQDTGLEGQNMINECLLGVRERTGIPVVCTNDVRYIQREDADTQAVMTAISRNARLSDGRAEGYGTDEFYLKSCEEMYREFSHFADAVENTVKIASMCNYSIKGGNTVLPDFALPDGMTDSAYLHDLAFKGLDRKIAEGRIVLTAERTLNAYRGRIQDELFVIAEMGYSSYFLIVADFVGYAKSKGIPVGPGRGSGAGSLVAFLIGITEVDPLVYGLLFEAFLNRERISMPDFDIDFGDRRRDEVIAYVSEKYGKDNVAQITTFGTLAAKAALRDTARVLGIDKKIVDELISHMPDEKDITISRALDDPKFSIYPEESPDIERLVETARGLEGLPRNASTHAAGVVITPKPLTEYLPLASNGGVTVTQYDMDTVAKLGLLKFDFLALRCLTVIDDAVNMIRKKEKDFDLSFIPLDDGATYKMISDGRTDGIFQLESPGMTRMLKKMKPEKMTDIMVALALFRPGPMDSIDTFLSNRARGRIDYKIPILSKILDETNGCIVYQEQVMEIFRSVAGYSYGRADIVRRAIAKKKPGVIEKERDGFVSGAVSNGWKEEDALALYGEMTDFANYGFKKSHAAAYALLSYRTAYLKAHYPSEYYSALLTSVSGDAGKTSLYMSSCAKQGIKLLPPDVNKSYPAFTSEDGAIRFGLASVKGIGEQFALRIVNVREDRPFKTFEDFVTRMMPGGISRPQMESLIRSGSCDLFGVFRKTLWCMIDFVVSEVNNSLRGHTAGQIDIFGNDSITFEYPKAIDEYPLEEYLAFEKEYCGTAFSGHLLDGYSDNISDVRHSDISLIDDTCGGKTFTLCGMITKVNQRITKAGLRMQNCQLEDRFSSVSLVIFPKLFLTVQDFVGENSAVCVTGNVTVEEGYVRLLAQSVTPLERNGKYVKKAPERHEEPQKVGNPPRAQSEAAGKSAGNAGSENLPSSENPPRAQSEAVKKIKSDVGSENLPSSERPPRAQGEAVEKSAGNAGSENLPSSENPPRAQSEAAEKKASKLYVRVPSITSPEHRRAAALASIFEGDTPLIFYDSGVKEYKPSGQGVALSAFFMKELTEIVGEGNAVAK